MNSLTQTSGHIVLEMKTDIQTHISFSVHILWQQLQPTNSEVLLSTCPKFLDWMNFCEHS